MIEYDGPGPQSYDEKTRERLGHINLSRSILNLDFASKDDQHGNANALCDVKMALLRGQSGMWAGISRLAGSLLTTRIPDSLRLALGLPEQLGENRHGVIAGTGARVRFYDLEADLAWLVKTGRLGGWNVQLGGKPSTMSEALRSVDQGHACLHLGQMELKGGLSVGSIKEGELASAKDVSHFDDVFDAFATFDDFGDLVDVCLLRSDCEMAAMAGAGEEAWREMNGGKPRMRFEGDTIFFTSSDEVLLNREELLDFGSGFAKSFVDNQNKKMSVQPALDGRALLVQSRWGSSQELALAIGADGRLEGARGLLDSGCRVRSETKQAAQARAAQVERQRLSDSVQSAPAAPRKALRM